MKHLYFGVHAAALYWLTAKLAHAHKRVLLVCKDAAKVEQAVSNLSFFEREANICTFPVWDVLPLEALSPSIDISAARLNALQIVKEARSFICITSSEALMQRILPWEFFSELSFSIAVNSAADHESLVQKFSNASYRQVGVVNDLGDFAVRGSVIDFFPFGAESPMRVEIQAGRAVKLTHFDPDTQRSIREIDRALVLPVREIVPYARIENPGAIKERGKKLGVPPSELNTLLAALENNDRDLPGIEMTQMAGFNQLHSFLQYLPPDTDVVIEDKSALTEKIEDFWRLLGEHEARLSEEHRFFPAPEKIYFQDALFSSLEEFNQHYVSQVDILSETHEEAAVHQVHAVSNFELKTRLRTLIGTGKALDPLKKLVQSWRKESYRIAFVVGTQARAERLQKTLLSLGLDAPISQKSGSAWMHGAAEPPFVVLLGNLSEGFSLNAEKLIFIAENEVFPEKSYRRAPRSKMTIKRILNSLAQLASGDHIVHTDFGIGIYRGLRHLEVEGVQGDFLHIEYADSTLYLPVHNIGKVQKFYAGEGEVPVVDKLGSSRWTKTKIKVKQALVQLAGDLINLYAQRSVAKGWRFEPYGAEDERFADGFPFSETPDQMRSIQEVLSDMADQKPMDRLVCGDVGFGKTEVALRAAFKCVQHSRQVAVLVPTTILVEQHHRTFSRRFADYPVKVSAVSRFYSRESNKETLENLAAGNVDIIIGTHRLLQKDVRFKDLGLLIIDEEHRFGVKQKERLKQMKTEVDVLSMTATPIPRTLYMSLLDIRDASLIATAPHDRKVIRSYVAAFSDSLVRDSILRELQRGGQVFFLHNRVQSIAGLTARLKELVPEARFEHAHGQMSETQLENIMQRFLAGQIDVLVSTTIIESGLDIPNANTIIIDRADTFGLAQLYQLRGRVGRSSKQAYAYFLIPKSAKLNPAAKQRLHVLQSIDDLGMGFNLAMRDLEIRGAGNLLGKEQSGNVLAVGFELYSKILKEAVLNVKGQALPAFEAIDPEMKLNLPAYIPEYYIPDISERLVMYQRLAMIVSSREADELLLEIEDRFGAIPQEVKLLLEIMRLRGLLRHYGVVKAELTKSKFLLSFTHQSPIAAEKIVELVRKQSKTYAFSRNQVFAVNLQNGTGAVNTDPIHLFEVSRELLSTISSQQISF